MSYDPKEYINQLQQLLGGDKKKIGFLFGTGTSMARKKGAKCEKNRVPSMDIMTEEVKKIIEEESFKKAIVVIEKELVELKLRNNIENILSTIIQKTAAAGKEKLCGLTQLELESLRKKIEKEIIRLVSVHPHKDEFLCELIHCNFVRWISDATRKHSIEIFTTNYDLLFEIAFENNKIPYFDGFVGCYEPFFHSASVDNMNFLIEYPKLWKMHGSLGWYSDGKRIVRGFNQKKGEDLIIYPSFLKYDDTRRHPYNSFIDRLSKFIQLEDTVLFISGYSFGDKHINDIIISALERSSSSHIYVLYFDKIMKDAKKEYGLLYNEELKRIAENQRRISVYGMEGAYIAGKYDVWKLKNEPDKTDSINIDCYFDMDAPEPKEKTGKNEYNEFSGKGEFVLPDFAKFVEFLSEVGK
jgi:hypothetical protein